MKQFVFIQHRKELMEHFKFRFLHSLYDCYYHTHSKRGEILISIHPEKMEPPF